MYYPSSYSNPISGFAPKNQEESKESSETLDSALNTLITCMNTPILSSRANIDSYITYHIVQVLTLLRTEDGIIVISMNGDRFAIMNIGCYCVNVCQNPYQLRVFVLTVSGARYAKANHKLSTILLVL